MNYYFAPMEGITGYIYRNAHHKYFKGIDKYFTPFISPNQHGKFSSKELNDILPEHNKGYCVVPQILTNNATDFIRTVHSLKAYGYNEMNLNLGCPSGTVVSKGKGSGFLAKPDDLHRFLETIFNAELGNLSIKTRIGKDDPEEWEVLMEIFNDYPMTELIIHPRIQKDFYKNKPRMEAFEKAVKESKNKIVYNGDIFTKKDYDTFISTYPMIEDVMIGRGLLTNPHLVAHLKGEGVFEKHKFVAFHQELVTCYQEVLSGDRNVLFKMKELWYYLAFLFEENPKLLKKIKKAQTVSEYLDCFANFVEEQAINEARGFSFLK